MPFHALLRNLFRRDRAERDLDSEVRAHLDLLADEHIRAGRPPGEARRAARIELGGVEQVKEEVRSVRSGVWLEAFFQDLRFGARQLLRNPGFTTVAVLTLALGIGANTAIFTAVNALLLRDLPAPDSGRLVFGLAMRESYDPFLVSLLEYAAYRDRNHCFASSGVADTRSFNLIGRDGPERVAGAGVQADFLTTLGVAPILGRTFTPAEDRPGGPPVALVSYGLWKRRFAGDPGLLGQSLNLNGSVTTVVGIMPASFDYPHNAEIWIPLQADLYGLPLSARGSPGYYMVARLRPGVTVPAADAELKAIARNLEKEYPQIRRGWSVSVIPLRWQLMFDPAGRVEKSSAALLGAVGFLLLICCANVASLVLARGVARERELAVRRALGAPPMRIVRQLATEALLLAVLGALGGLLAAFAILPLLSALNPIHTDGFASVLRAPQIDGRVLGFLAVAAALTAALSGVLPALKIGRSKSLMPVILEGGQRSGQGAAGRRWLAALVIGEIALAVGLLSGGGLILRSFQLLQHMDPGFRPDHLLTMRIELPPAKYQDFPSRVAFAGRVLERVRMLPGVLSAGMTNNMPLGFPGWDTVFAVEGRPAVSTSEVLITSNRVVTPDYLPTLGVSLVRGRLLDEHDCAGSLPVAVITEEFARQAWPNQDPIGKRVKRLRPGQEFPWMTVVGVVHNVKEDGGNFRINRPVWYLPYSQNPNSYPLDLVARISGSPAGLAREIGQAVLEVDPDQPVSNVQTMEENLAGMLVTERFSAILMTALAALGLLLAIIGLYGIMAYTVGRQTAELGLRAALGARPVEIVKLVLRRGASLVAAGMAAGLLCALFLSRFLSGLLYSVRPNDPLTLFAISLLLAAVAFIACYVPARRASRVDPMVALRHE